MARNICQYADEDGIGCTNTASRKNCPTHKPMAEALKKRRQREAHRQAEAIDLAPESDTPLARARLGLQPQEDDVTARFATRHERLIDYSRGGTGLAARGDYMDTPYSARSRRAVQEASAWPTSWTTALPRAEWTTRDRGSSGSSAA